MEQDVNRLEIAMDEGPVQMMKMAWTFKIFAISLMSDDEEFQAVRFFVLNRAYFKNTLKKT